MQSLILIFHVLVAICLVVLVLMQHGKGADAGAAFGSGASNTMFGSVGTTPFLMKVTVVLTAIFFSTSIGLSYLSARTQQLQQLAPVPTQTAPLSRAPGLPSGSHF